MVVADTGAILALLDRDDRHHAAVRGLFAADPDAWILPWAILPEVDYLVWRTLGARAGRVWLADLAAGGFAVEGGKPADLVRAHKIDAQYDALSLGLVDSVVMAVAERLVADIATLDLRHFGAVALAHAPRLLPRDTPAATRRRRP